MADLTCSPQVFAILTGLVEERSGLSYGPADRVIFEAKAAQRAAEAGYESMLDYYYFLRYDDPERREFDALIEALLVQETFFFRELTPLNVAIEQLLVPRIQRGERPRVWCAACATGEEPLTLAMLLAERGLDGKVELIASDISERALERAQRGVFGQRALRASAPPPSAGRFLEPRGKELVADARLIARIDFRRINLIEHEAVQAVGPCDLILCRNVLIYFDDKRVKNVVGELAGNLKPDGALLVGVSESLLRFDTGLHCEELTGVFFYRKRSR